MENKELKKETFGSILWKVIFFVILHFLFSGIISFVIGFIYGVLQVEPNGNLLSALSIIIGTPISAYYAIKIMKKDNNIDIKNRINFKTINYKYLLGTTLFIMSLSFLLNYILINLIGLKNESNILGKLDFGGILMIITVVIIAPIFEEIIFRFAIIEKIKTKYSDIIAITLSSVIFALIHSYGLLGSISIFIMFIIIAYIYVRTKNLIYPIVIHFVNNVINAILQIIEAYYPNSTTPKFPNNTIHLTILVICLVLGFYIVYKEKDKVKVIENK